MTDLLSGALVVYALGWLLQAVGTRHPTMLPAPEWLRGLCLCTWRLELDYAGTTFQLLGLYLAAATCVRWLGLLSKAAVGHVIMTGVALAAAALAFDLWRYTTRTRRRS